jgi:hypothetical protein
MEGPSLVACGTMAATAGFAKLVQMAAGGNMAILCDHNCLFSAAD